MSTAWRSCWLGMPINARPPSSSAPPCNCSSARASAARRHLPRAQASATAANRTSVTKTKANPPKLNSVSKKSPKPSTNSIGVRPHSAQSSFCMPALDEIKLLTCNCCSDLIFVLHQRTSREPRLVNLMRPSLQSGQLLLLFHATLCY